MDDPFEYDVFISFASGDEEIVRPIWQDLSASGLRVFWSDTTLKDNLGESWFDVIQQSLQRSRHFLLVWTAAAASSKWVKREYVAFLQDREESSTRRLVPYLVGKADIADLPYFLRQIEACRSGDPEVMPRLTRLLGGVDIPGLKQQVAELTSKNMRLSEAVRTLTQARELRVGHSVVADQVLALKQARELRERQAVTKSGDAIRSVAAAAGPVATGASPLGQSDMATIETKDPDGGIAFLGSVTLSDGTQLTDCRIWDHHSTYGGGFNEKSVGFSTSIEAACKYETNRARKLLYPMLARINVVPLMESEMECANQLSLDYRKRLLKCDVVFHIGSTMASVYLMPYDLWYATSIEQGEITRDTVRSVSFFAARPQ